MNEMNKMKLLDIEISSLNNNRQIYQLELRPFPMQMYCMDPVNQTCTENTHRKYPEKENKKKERIGDCRPEIQMRLWFSYVDYGQDRQLESKSINASDLSIQQ